MRVLDQHAKGHALTFVELAQIGTVFKLHAHANGHSYLDIGLDYTSNRRPRGRSRMLIPRFDILSEQVHTQKLDDVVDRETDYYIPVDRVPLSEAFLGLRSEHYELTPEDRETLTERWEEWIANNPAEPEDPRYVINEPYLDGHEYPTWDIEQPYLSGHTYPPAPDLDDVVIDDPFVVEPTPPIQVTVTHTAFPSFDGLTNPAGEFIAQPLTIADVLDGPQLPEVILDPDLYGFDPVDLTLRGDLDGLDPVDLTLNPELDGFEHPDLDLGPTLDGFEYPDP